ncbi:protein-arginine deiminase family protein [Nonomuraea typhae]|uniref:protein-arginine deiminase family protein n=1 Tax=Nonomuraea typhae TaxID=2603600 RepID=UPI0012FC5CCA|nr:protein-arginine deiminase family protein [Nonomuraea typhae]
MCAFRLHADYDRDGRVSGRPEEWAERGRDPGAVLRPNLDADTRRLPGAVTPAGPARPDRELQVKTAGDDEPLRMQVQEVTAAPGPLFVVLEGGDPRRIAVVDGTGVRIRPKQTRTGARYPLPAGPYPKQLALEAVDLAASPATNRLLGSGPPPPPGARVVVRLERDAATGAVVEDEAVVTLAPLVLIGNAGRLERLYMCDVRSAELSRPLDDNGPAVADVRAALAQIGVPLTLIPDTVHGGDSWIQDQYQLGFTRTPDGVQRVLLHAPRTRADAVRHGVPNLATLMAGHFLSKDLGVCQAFWDRELTVPGGGGPVRMGFAESDLLLAVMNRVKLLRRQMAEVISRYGTAAEIGRMAAAIGPVQADVWKSRLDLDLLLSHLRGVVAEALKRAVTPDRHTVLTRILADAAGQVAAMKRDMPVSAGGDRVILTLQKPPRDAILTGQELARLDARLSTWHSSHNYGGNLEVGPPSKNAPAGVVVVGNTTGQAIDGSTVTDMDPDLLAFLRGQAHGHQRVLEVDTSWLDVGHVDEMLAFVPDPRDPRAPGAALRASPLVALAILEEARKEFMSGLTGPELADYARWTFPYDRTRLNSQGARPVTHLLRGLQWMRVHGPGQSLPTEPPEIYQSLAHHNALRLQSVHVLPEPGSPWAAPGEVVYPAGISLFELRAFTDGLNADLEAAPEPPGPDTPAKGHLLEAHDAIQTEYDGRLPILKLPVLFDNRSRATGRSAAFTPNLVNLQVAGDRLLIPRPHGPRMSPESAARVLRAVTRAVEDLPAARFTPQWLRARGLVTSTFWARRHSVAGASGSDADQLAAAFADGFPAGRLQVPAARVRGKIAELIVRANAGAFDGRGFLKGTAWRRLTIPENTVDLFEAWTEAIADRLGYRVHWVEAWYYHVRLGSIHCGTNVLRAAPRGTLWWRA